MACPGNSILQQAQDITPLIFGLFSFFLLKGWSDDFQALDVYELERRRVFFIIEGQIPTRMHISKYITHPLLQVIIYVLRETQFLASSK